MAKFPEALQMVLGPNHEGSAYVDNLNDKGGPSRYGISLRFYRANVKSDATERDIKDLTVNDAAALYQKFWWQRAAYCDITSQKIASRVFDLHVNCYHGISMLQQAVNACIGGHLVVDNMLGSKTLAIVNALDEDKLYDMLIEVARGFYKDLVKKNPKESCFLKGWLNRLKD